MMRTSISYHQTRKYPSEKPMKTIPTEFKKYKADYKLMRRDGLVCLYSRQAYGDTDYEVVIAQVAKADWVVNGVKALEAGDESLPSSEQWGSKGWTYSKGELALAELRFSERAELARIQTRGATLPPKWYVDKGWPSTMRRAGTGELEKEGA